MWLVGCSLSRPDVTECSSNARCREVFGPGSVCTTDGFCETSSPSPRCSRTHPSDLLSHPENHPNAVLLGSLMDRSVTTHQAREDAIRLAVTQVNEGGGLRGRDFGLVLCNVAEDSAYDSRSRAEAAVDSAHYLADAIGAVAIVGPSASTDALAVYSSLAGRDVLVISPSATSSALTDVEGKPTDEAPGRFWRTTAPDNLQGEAIAIYLGQSGVKDLTIVYEQGAYGEGLASVVESSFTGSGGHVTATSFASTSARDAAVVGAGKGAAPWVLFVSSQTADSAAFLNAAATSSGYAAKNLFLTDAAANADLLANIKGAVTLFPRVRGSRFAAPAGAVYEQFRASFKAAYQREANDFSYVAHAYDASWLTFYGSARSDGQEGVLHGLGIARGLRRVSQGIPVDIVPLTWGDVGKELSLGGSVDVTGASGNLDFDPLTEETTSPVEVWRIAKNGGSLEVEQTLVP